MPYQYHNEHENGDRHHEPGQPEQLPDEEDAGDGDHGRKIDLPLHNDRRYNVGLNQVNPHSDGQHGECLGEPETPSAKSAGRSVENRVPKNGTSAATPAKT